MRFKGILYISILCLLLTGCGGNKKVDEPIPLADLPEEQRSARAFEDYEKTKFVADDDLYTALEEQGFKGLSKNKTPYSLSVVSNTTPFKDLKNGELVVGYLFNPPDNEVNTAISSYVETYEGYIEHVVGFMRFDLDLKYVVADVIVDYQTSRGRERSVLELKLFRNEDSEWVFAE
jgi:hypothetical protein